MRKLHLDPEELHVETFDTLAAEGAERGTVRGHIEPQTWEDILTCGGGCDGADGLAALPTRFPGGTCLQTCGDCSWGETVDPGCTLAG